jgi:hypothetical protein
VFDYSRAYELQLSTDFIASFTFSYKINKDKLAHEFSLKMMNVTQSKELRENMYNYRTGRPEMQMVSVAMPSINYKLEF